MVTSKVLYILGHSALGLLLSLVHILHVSTLFENQSKFSHLSALERELSLSPREAFYYQFYKRLITADSLEAGMDSLKADNLTQFDEQATVNSLRRFHIAPELAMAFLYRNFIALADSLNIPTVNCYYVEPDENSTVDDPKVFVNCDGLGEAIYFYLAIAWSLSAITIFLLYMYGYFLHRNFVAGCAAVVYFFCTHESATSIHRTPMARHNFAVPFIVWQTFYLNLYVDRHAFDGENNRVDGGHHRNFAMITSLVVFSTIANLCWEMSSHIFLVQSLTLFILLQLRDKNDTPYIAANLVLDFALTQIIANALAALLMQGNIKFLISGNMSTNLALVIYIVRMRVMRLPTEEESANFRSPTRRFFYVLFFFLSTAWFVQDLMDRFAPYSLDATGSHHIDLLCAHLHLKLPTFFTLLAYYKDSSAHDLIGAITLRVYCLVFLFKNLSVFVSIRFYRAIHARRQKIDTDALEMRERAKNYVIEDFLETNRVTMRDLSDPRTEQGIQENLRVLEACNYDYQLFQRRKTRVRSDVRAERENFLSDIRRLKTQIQRGEEGVKGGSQGSVGGKVGKMGKGVKLQEEAKGGQVGKEGEKSEEAEERSQRNKGGQGGEKNVVGKKGGQRSESENEANSPEEDEKLSESENEENPPQKEENKTSPHRVQPHYAFVLLQTTLLAFIGLKFVLTPFLCLIAATLPARSWFTRTSRTSYWIFYIFLLGCTINYPGLKSLQFQYEYKSEFRNPELESLVTWIEKTEPSAVFAAPLDLATHLLLTTRRPMVNHPLIEFPDMLERTRALYSVFSKRPSTEVYNQLVKLRVQFVVIPYESCFLATSEGVRLIDIFDYLEPEHYERKAFCMNLFQKTNPTFLKVFENSKYIVIQIFSQSIQLELKKKGLAERHM